MSYKTIVAYLAKPDGVQAVMNTALPLAENFGAHLIGFHVSSGMPMIGTIGMQVPSQVIEQFAQFMREDAAALEKAFSTAVKGEKVHAEWRQNIQKVLGTDILYLISEQTRCADIVVMGQSDSEQHVEDLTADIIIASGRPVIVVPKDAGATNLAGKIVIAWDGSREATRATFDALPLLREAQSVSLVTIQRDRAEEAKKFDGGEMAELLSRHGVKAEVVVLDRVTSAGVTLTKYVSEHGCDLIVMGCYGHSRLRERLFGGATRHILQEMNTPVLMSH